MEKRELEERLRSYGKCGDIRGSHREERILSLLLLEEKTRNRWNFPDFAMGQFCLLGRWSLIWELVWLIGFLLLMYGNQGYFTTESVMPAVSMLSPLLLIVFAADIGRVTNQSMLEIESTTRYSVSQILLFRLLAHGGMQLGIVFVGIFVCHRSLGQSLTKMLLYGYTPLIFSGAVLLLFVSRFTGKALQYAGVSISVLLITLLFAFCRFGVFLHQFGNPYAEGNMWIWKAILWGSILVFGLEVMKIKKGVRMDEIGTMFGVEML
ncbi:MAG: hypothetical protein ACI4FY_11990 [Acetatifactor sp.]